MTYKTITVTESEGIAVLTLNRPESMNALNTEVLKELSAAFDDVATNPEVDVLIITGAGKAFVAGADISEMQPMTPLESEAFHIIGVSVIHKLERMEKPVLAAINGFALGGGNELAMAADIRIASEKARFGQPEVSIGISPGFAATQQLSRLVGKAKAKELLFTGSLISASEAERIGLVNKVVPHERLMEAVLEMAQKIQSNAQVAVRYCKKAVDLGSDMSMEAGLEMGKVLNALCFSTEDQKEGMTAFLEKRSPRFVKR